MSKALGKWKLTILDIKICKPRKNIKVIVKHSLIDNVYAVKFDCKKFYEYTYNEEDCMFYIENEGSKTYVVPFLPEEFGKYFENVAWGPECYDEK